MTGDHVRLEAVWRVFPRGQVAALRGVSLTIRGGDYVAISGPSGSGKSTLLHLAGGLDQPTRGRVILNGHQPRTPREWTRARARGIGFVFQSFHLLAGLTVAENVEIPMFGVLGRERDRAARVASLLDRVGLSHRARHRASDLSGGESQRVAIARALANSPNLILADEPTGNLDSQNSAGILSLLEELHAREQLTLAIVTHDPAISRRATRRVHLLDGEIVDDDGPGGTP